MYESISFPIYSPTLGMDSLFNFIHCVGEGEGRWYLIIDSICMQSNIFSKELGFLAIFEHSKWLETQLPLYTFWFNTKNKKKIYYNKVFQMYFTQYHQYTSFWSVSRMFLIETMPNSCSNKISDPLSASVWFESPSTLFLVTLYLCLLRNLAFCIVVNSLFIWLFHQTLSITQVNDVLFYVAYFLSRKIFGTIKAPEVFVQWMTVRFTDSPLFLGKALCLYIKKMKEREL